MTSPLRPNSGLTLRRGVALLLVLGVLVVTVSALTIAARVAGIARVNTSLAASERVDDELLVASQAPIERWLLERSSAAVVSPKSAVPELVVLDDDLLFPAPASPTAPAEPPPTAWHVRIAAYDLEGMVPLQSVLDADPIVEGVPIENARLVQDAFAGRADPAAAADASAEIDALYATLTNSTQVGAQSSFSPAVPKASIEKIFPTPASASAHLFASAALSATDLPASSPDAASATDAEPPALLASVAILPDRAAGPLAAQPDQTLPINVNTAPMPLVESALRLAGRSGALESIRTARAAGHIYPIGDTSAPAPGSDPSTQKRVIAVSSSHAWAFRVDLTAGRLTRSWWCVYRKSTASGVDPARAWTCVFRRAIDE